MGGLDRARDLDAQRERLALRQRPPRQTRCERLAFDKLEDEVRRAGGLFEPVDRRDVRMIQGSEGLSLPPEAGQPRRVGGERWGQRLDRDIAPKPRVARAVDLAHASPAERSNDLVRSEPGVGGQHHGATLAGTSLPRHQEPELMLVVVS